MKVIDHISRAKSTLFSIEILPPLKGQNINSLFETMDELMDFSPAFVDVTYHREEYVFKDAGNEREILPSAFTDRRRSSDCF
jgi:methylenetetrahydrofolate reductase (NADPH)